MIGSSASIGQQGHDMENTGLAVGQTLLTPQFALFLIFLNFAASFRHKKGGAIVYYCHRLGLFLTLPTSTCKTMIGKCLILGSSAQLWSLNA